MCISLGKFDKHFENGLVQPPTGSVCLETKDFMKICYLRLGGFAISLRLSNLAMGNPPFEDVSPN